MKIRLLSIIASLSLLLMISTTVIIAEESPEEISVEDEVTNNEEGALEDETSDEEEEVFESQSELESEMEIISEEFMISESNNEAAESDLQRFFNQAVRKFKEENPGAEVLSIGIEKELNDDLEQIYVFEIEGVDAELEYDFEYVIDASGVGKIIKLQSLELDDEDKKVKIQEAIELESYRTIDEFNATIEEDYPGVDIFKWEIERDDHKVVWTAKFDDAVNIHEIEVNALTGDVIRVTKSTDDED